MNALKVDAACKRTAAVEVVAVLHRCMQTGVDECLYY